MRGQYIISQALTIGVKMLRKYEDKDSPLYSVRQSEPSNRADMEFLLDAFPLYKIHEKELWYPINNKSKKE